MIATASSIAETGKAQRMNPFEWPEWIAPGAWLAMDKDGTWCVHAKRPARSANHSIWMPEDGSEFFELLPSLVDFTPPKCDDWRDSLRQKPID